MSSDTRDTSVFHVTRMGAGQPYKTKSYTPTEDERVFYEFLAPNGERLGVQLNADGSLTIGGWDADGTWTDLVVRRPCESGNCKVSGVHTSQFPLDQYVED